MKRYKLFILSFIIIISGCATPPEVKQLSLKQLEYLDVLTTAMNVQSEGLISVAESLKEEAGGKIACYQQNSVNRLNALMTKTIPTMDREKRIETKRKIFAQADILSKTAETAREKLSTDFIAIKEKTLELQGYLTKIKEVQTILDGYIQSEKIGEKLLKTTAGHTNVSGFLGTINTYIPKIKSTTESLKALLSVLKKK
ncbi:MAG: hypothetical protein Q9M50_05945 [Methylococcales bacterium]|nr:hypothetical protein [Methylococcales bacterium]